MSNGTRLIRILGLCAAAILTACSSSAGTPRPATGGSSASPLPAATSASTAPTSASTPAAAFTLAVSHPTVWLCRPGMAGNPCDSGLNATVVQPDGMRAVAAFTAAKSPKVDCFYVYPTLSEAETAAAPLAPEPAAVAVTKAQVGRFQSVCRLFVPVYRQLTRAGLAEAIAGQSIPTGVLAQATGDVVSAWHDYLDHYNQGRGVVLLGHSQGAGQVISLLKTEIDRSPSERARLVSAIALGGNLLVPIGKDVGGDLKTIPACRLVTQHACVVAYSMFSNPPPANSYFGRADTAIGRTSATSAGLQVLCVNPADLRGGTAALHPYFPTQMLGGTHLTNQAQTSLPNFPTGFVALPGQLTGTCRAASGASWLQIDHPTRGAGSADLPLAQAETLGPRWGLHLLDFNADQGDLINLVGAEAASWH
jgi:hypothetical protein